jgi:hypothetical protein
MCGNLLSRSDWSPSPEKSWSAQIQWASPWNTWTLSYSSNKGTASSFKFLGTAKYCFSDKGTTKSFLHSWKHIHKMEDSITGCNITSICMCPQKSDQLCLLGANIRVEPSQNERAPMTFCFLSCTNIWK